MLDGNSEWPFVGVKITSGLQRQLDQYSSVHKRYFDRSEPQSLQIVTIDGEEALAGRGASVRSLALEVRS